MSVYTNQTNITQGTSAYVTRKDLVDFASTITNDLSGIDIGFLFANPNFSSITMNPTGSIYGGASVSAEGALGLSTIQLAYTAPYVGTTLVPSLVGALTNQYQPLAVSASVIKPGATGGNYYTSIAPTSASIFNTTNVPTPIWNMNTAAMSLALSNISSINGVNPTTAGTTFTNLTGVNLTTTGTLTSPQVISVSSINGLQFSTAYSNVWAGGGSVTAPSGVPTLVASISLPTGYLKPNTNYTFDVPILVGTLPVTPTGFVLFMGCRLGTNGTVNYQIPLYITAGSGGVSLQMTGVAQTNAISVASQTIDIVVVQQSGSSFVCPISNPTTGLNTYTIKPLT